jgi:ribosomal protection tetracycline resistance protein
LLRRTLNLGILAHVDAGKTTLTERLLYAAGVIDAVGSVDDGTTQTDFLALERQRGITIRSAVVSFPLAGVTVNLIDTPGHPDFIAEVERVLGVLDGAVLVVSAVEGVQSQTRLLMRALERLGIPTLIYVNKIDRLGAGYDRVLRQVSERLAAAIVPLGAVEAIGTREARFRPWEEDDAAFNVRLAELLAEQDDALLAAYVEGDELPHARLRQELAAQTARRLVHPVLFGSAITGAGSEALMSAIAELLPAAQGDADAAVSGSVFKIERGRDGERIALVRLFHGTLHVRERVRVGTAGEDKVTAVAVFDRGGAERRQALLAGEIGQLRGLAHVQVGDAVGEPPRPPSGRAFAPPTLEAVVVPASSAAAPRLRVALGQLAEQDPLIGVRLDERGRLSVSLYGEVQKEVIEATLAGEYGIEVAFCESTPIAIERPAARGEAVEVLRAPSNPFLATIALRVDPAAAGSGVAFGLDVDPRTTPLFIYKTLDSFREHMEQYVREALAEGLLGWEVTDCTVTMTRCVYSVPDGPPSRRGPLSTAADFRKLTPIVVMRALEDAGTVVCEPTVTIALELPQDSLRGVLGALARLGAGVAGPALADGAATIEATLPAAHAHALQQQLPRLTGGEGVAESRFAGFQPVVGAPPTRPRTTPNPLNLEEYLRSLAGAARATAG